MGSMAQERRIGMHMRTGRGLDKAVDLIKTLQLKAVQIFTGNPSAWRSAPVDAQADRKSTRLNSSHVSISYAVFCLKKKIKNKKPPARPNLELHSHQST